MKKINLLTLAFILCHVAFGQSLFTNPLPLKFEDNALNFLEAGEKHPRFFIHGITNLNSTEEMASSIQASQKILLTLLVRKQEIGVKGKKGLINSGLDFTIGMNVLNLKPTGIDKDSFDLASLMFPETGNFGFMINPAWHWRLRKESDHSHRYSSEISFSLRHNKVNQVPIRNSNGDKMGDPENIDFSVLNLNLMPIRYNFYYQPEKDFKVELNLGLYYNLFMIPNEDAASFNKMFPTDKPLLDQNGKVNISSLGFKTTCGFNGFMLFADLRYNLKTQAFEDNNPYKGFIFNAGFAQNLSLLSK